jgi:hypothetical protein
VPRHHRDQGVDGIGLRWLALAARPGRLLHDRVVGVAQQGHERDAVVGDAHLQGAPADDGRRVGQAGGDVVVGRRTGPVEGSEGAGPHGRRRIGEQVPGGALVAAVPRFDRGGATLRHRGPGPASAHLVVLAGQGGHPST